MDGLFLNGLICENMATQNEHKTANENVQKT